MTIIVGVDLSESAVAHVAQRQGVLATVGEEEASRAYEVALADEEIQKTLEGKVASPSGYPEPIQTAGGPCSEAGGHRCVMVVLQASGDLLRAFVDLTDERVDFWRWEPS